MSAWKLPWRPLREPAPPQEEALVGEPPVDENADLEVEAVDELGAVCRERRLRLELPVTEEGAPIPVSLTESNANHILEVTQRARECRDRELARVPQVYNFGSEPRWSGEDG